MSELTKSAAERVLGSTVSNWDDDGAVVSLTGPVIKRPLLRVRVLVATLTALVPGTAGLLVGPGMRAEPGELAVSG